jgi:hypothetical protein
MNTRRIVLFCVGLSLCASSVTWAQTNYSIRPIASLGSQIGNLTLHPKADLVASGLNNKDEIVFATSTNSRGYGEHLVRYAASEFTPIVSPGGVVAGAATWARDLLIGRPASTNEDGNIAFSADVDRTGNLGTFFWESKTRTLTTLALKGMSAPNGLTFAGGGRPPGLLLNNGNQIAFCANVTDSANRSRTGVFLRGPDGQVQAVALPDQALPDGGKIDVACSSSLNDSGVVAFQALPTGEGMRPAAYLWERGSIRRAVPGDARLPDGKSFGGISRIFVNNQNRNALVVAYTRGGPNNELETGLGLYLLAEGRITTVAEPGRALPGGAVLKFLQEGQDGGVFGSSTLLQFNVSVSPANDRGQHAFLVVHQDGGEGAYLIDADGNVSPILRTGMTTEFGTVKSIGENHAPGAGGARSVGIGLNNQGKVVLTATIGDRPPTLYLLTPITP